jgi:hypothetical protein
MLAMLEQVKLTRWQPFVTRLWTGTESAFLAEVACRGRGSGLSEITSRIVRVQQLLKLSVG